MPIPLWIDCDPGHDDAVAIFLALFHPEFKLVGISTSYGNSSLQHTTYNARALLRTLNSTNIPVFSGASRPLEKDPVFAPDIHGESGLEGTDELLTPIVPPRNEFGDIDSFHKALLEAIETNNGELSIAAVGPLTNISVFFKKYPQARRLIKRLSIMGGGFNGVYNRGFSEFNIWCDPKASKYIFDDPILSSKAVLVPLNVTHTVICTEELQKKILNDPNTTRIRKMFHELMTYFASSYNKAQPFSKGPPVHDPVAIYALLSEYSLLEIGEVYRTLKLNCIEHGGEEGKLEYLDDPNGVKVIFEINVEKFWDTLLDTFKSSDARI